MKQLAGHYVLILLVSVVVFFTNLGGARLWDRDEPRNAGCALEMMQRGDWIVPIFNDQLRDAKPVLLYWLIMTAYTAFGVNELAARFPSAALAVGTVLATYHIGRRLFHAQAALWAALILSTSLMFDVVGRAATPDSALIFCGTIALLIFVLGTMKPQVSSGDAVAAPQLRSDRCFFPQRWVVVALMYAMMGVGILAKGPVGMVVPTAVIGMFLLVMRLPPIPAATHPNENEHEIILGTNWKRWLRLLRPFEPKHFLKTMWQMRPLTAIAVAASLAIPWYVLVGWKTEGDFLWGFFIKEHFGRATTAMENHDGSLLYYPATILAGFFPWSIFMVPLLVDMVRRLRRGDAWGVGYVLVACWVGVYIGLFTLATTKLPNYITPCYPALALMTGCFIFHWTHGTELSSRIWPKVSVGVLALVGVLMTTAIPFVSQHYLPGLEWLAVVGLIPIGGAVVSFCFMQRDQFRWSAGALGVSAVLLSVAIFAGVAPQIDRQRRHDVWLGEIARRATEPQLAHFGPLEPSWVFYGRRPIRRLALESDTDSPRQRQRNWHPHPPVDVPSYFSQGRDMFLITTARHLPSIASRLPADVEVVAQVPYFLKREDLIVLGRKATTIRTAHDSHQVR